MTSNNGNPRSGFGDLHLSVLFLLSSLLSGALLAILVGGEWVLLGSILLIPSLIFYLLHRKHIGTDLAIFPDTHVLLHYQFFEFDWLDELSVDHIDIYLTDTVLTELDQKKGSRSDRLGRRAGKRLKKLHNLLGGHSSVEVCPGVVLHLCPELIDWDKLKRWNLDPNWNDDRIMAKAKLQQMEKRGVNVAIQTADKPLAIRQKAKELGLDILVPSDKYRTRPLEEEIAEEEKQPLGSLRLMFPNGKEHFELVFETPEKPSEEKLNREVELLKGQYPPYKIEPGPPIGLGIPTISTLMTQISKTEKLEYNQLLEEYFSSTFPEYQEMRYKRECLQRRTCKVPLLVVNNGSTPATSIIVEIDFPAEVTVISEVEAEEKGAFEDLSEPLLPDKPLSSFDKTSIACRLVNSRPEGLPIPPGAFHPYPDVENTKQGYTVTFPEVEKLHHQRSYELDPLIVIVGSPDLSGFMVKYRIFCDFPGTVERELNFRISYKQNE